MAWTIFDRSISYQRGIFFRQIMQINARDVNGIFQIDHHTSSLRFLWVTLVAISFFVVVCGGWAAKTNFFVFSQDGTSKYFEIALAIVFFLAVPAVIIVVGLIEIAKRPGIYFTGVRVVNQGVEFGTLTVDVNYVSYKKIWETKFVESDTSGTWRSTKKITNNAIDILIVLRKEQDLSKRLLLEQVVLSSRDERLFQIPGHNIFRTRWNTIVALSQGSLHLLGNDDGINSDKLSLFREETVRVISRWKHSFILSCTLKIIPSLANLDNVLAFGVLGGTNKTSSRNINDKVYQEKIFDSLNNEKNLSAGFNRDRS